MGEEVLKIFGVVVVGVVVHEGKSEGGEGIVFLVEGGVVGLDDGRVIGEKADEIVDDVGEEDEEEECGSDEGLPGGYAIVFGHGYEAEDVNFPEEFEAEVGLLLVDEGTIPE